ncbi:MAG: hypothetical protein IPJ38_00625 [Dechloromonas sp.]|uniref:Uncharacterized protein n=1 Tax=Candidatus Dechloromonas phosphorivorans TaxID=2899244 RepID=A0A935K768_9RHOO|nr:hypothetical protein [Candidatus Dechloromonas phosphorivorans]
MKAMAMKQLALGFFIALFGSVTVTTTPGMAEFRRMGQKGDEALIRAIAPKFTLNWVRCISRMAIWRLPLMVRVDAVRTPAITLLMACVAWSM